MEFIVLLLHIIGHGSAFVQDKHQALAVMSTVITYRIMTALNSSLPLNKVQREFNRGHVPRAMFVLSREKWWCLQERSRV